MKKGHIPTRMCVGCRQKKRQSDMIRLVLDPEGGLSPDRGRARRGRGYYLCAGLTCFTMARKKSRIGQFLKRNGLMTSLMARFLNEGLE